MTYQNTTYCPNLCLACSPNAIFGDTQSVENEQKLRLDYYVFGMPMHSRTFTGNGYKFGFNGQEKEDDIYGEGNTYSAEYWMYDSRLGRRWNVDPVDQINVSNYSCFGDNPIYYIDEGGDFKRKFWAKVYAKMFGGEVVQAHAGERKSEYYVMKEITKSSSFYGSSPVIKVSTKNDVTMYLPTVTKEIQVIYGFGENVRKKLAKKAATFVRNYPKIGKYPNPLYGAEAIIFDIGGTLVGAELDYGMSIILAGEDAGEVNFFKEIAGGVANEGGVSVEVGRVDISDNPHEFKESDLYGSREKGWIGAGEGITGSFGVAKGKAKNGNTVTTTSVSVGFGASWPPVSGGYNQGEIEKINKKTD
ncbi:MAG: hypothetical protein ACOCWG_04600 [bacterium]